MVIPSVTNCAYEICISRNFPASCLAGGRRRLAAEQVKQMINDSFKDISLRTNSCSSLFPSPPPYNILKPASWLVRQQVGLDSSDGWMDAGFSSTRSIDQLGRLGGKGCCMWGWRRWSEEREWRWLRWEGNGGVEGYEGDINAVRGLHILNRVRTRRRWERMSHTRIEIGW